jgi:RNA polymerase sigma-70 factor (ECF subfamily)
MRNSAKVHPVDLAALQDKTAENAFRSYSPALKNFCRRLLMDSALADDVVQQTFEIALRSFGDLRQPDKSRAWIFQIARNECLRILKTNRAAEWSDELAADTSPTPLDLTIGQDVRAIVTNAIEQLPGIYREAVVLRDMEGFTYAEIAQIAGVAISAIKFRIFRGRELLMERLDPVLKEWRMP